MLGGLEGSNVIVVGPCCRSVCGRDLCSLDAIAFVQFHQERKEKFTFHSNHNGSLIRRQPAAHVSLPVRVLEVLYMLFLLEAVGLMVCACKAIWVALRIDLWPGLVFLPLPACNQQSVFTHTSSCWYERMCPYNSSLCLCYISHAANLW